MTEPHYLTYWYWIGHFLPDGSRAADFYERIRQLFNESGLPIEKVSFSPYKGKPKTLIERNFLKRAGHMTAYHSIFLHSPEIKGTVYLDQKLGAGTRDTRRSGVGKSYFLIYLSTDCPISAHHACVDCFNDVAVDPGFGYGYADILPRGMHPVYFTYGNMAQQYVEDGETKTHPSEEWHTRDYAWSRFFHEGWEEPVRRIRRVFRDNWWNPHQIENTRNAVRDEPGLKAILDQAHRAEISPSLTRVRFSADTHLALDAYLLKKGVCI